jgi:hypothetical protein
MRKPLTVLWLGLSVMATACQKKEVLPNTPEDVIKAYQAFYDKNQFDEAKKLSTQAEQQRLNDVAKMVISFSADSTQLKTIFVHLECQTKGDTSLCECLLKDQDGTYNVQYRLIRFKGQWLVDAPQESMDAPDKLLESGIDTLINFIDIPK